MLVPWRWYYGYPSLPLWAVLGVLLVVPSKNRNRQAWLILILPLLVAGLAQALLLATGPSGGTETFCYFLTAAVIAWASVWLLAPWLCAERLAIRALWAWVVMLVVGVISYVGYGGLSFDGDAALSWTVFWGVVTMTLVVSMMFSGHFCRRSGRMILFMLWLALWMPVVCLVAMVVLMTIVAVTQGSIEILVALLLSSLMGTAMVSSGLYVLNLPAMLIARFSPLYRERFRTLFCPVEPPDPLDAPLQSGISSSAQPPPAGDETEGECPFARPDSP
ncbi:MAG: hypothetical protein JW888_02075 [Pirellulales bacterium]|nr:hypothetical protein [Pirellulales bacterium]